MIFFRCSADKPLSASSQRYEVLVSKKFRMAPRTAALSSTTRIQCLRAGVIEADITTVVPAQSGYAIFFALRRVQVNRNS